MSAVMHGILTERAEVQRKKSKKKKPSNEKKS